ncbi:MAG: serine hydrolase [Balneola sp.]|jgi:CubicO group peptidase (beta-lactamase class C family)|nr:serine hydrolase [Balneola sp.]MBE80824.1 serine hydrolase [Balneola sp.]|tara:strand:- start:955 stop:2214 length:1260 start_codon:yes stop_codon:yes gene_type:complete
MRISTLLIAMTMIAAVACTTTKTERIVDSQTGNRIDKALQSFVDSNRVAGASALIYEDGEEVYFGAFGHADRREDIPMSRESIAVIFSMTKPITGTALMQQYEQGKFELDDPLSDYLPEFRDVKVFEGMDDEGNPILLEPKRPLTVRDITRHTSGFANDGNHLYIGRLLQDAQPLNRENTLKEFAEKQASLPLEFHPGEEWYYGPSVDVQARLVEVLSGETFQDYVRENVLDPLGMNETRYFVPEEDRDRMSSLFQRNQEGELEQIPDIAAHSMYTQKWPLTPGGWGLASTLDDYMTFTQMLVNEGTLDGVQILKPETVKLMATNQLSEEVTERLWLPSKGQVGFGIDFAVRVAPPQSAEENMGTVGEFFWDGAASTLFWVDPVNELTAVLFVQVFPFAGTIHKDFRDAVYGPYQPTEN